jgi:hypothetical protein
MHGSQAGNGSVHSSCAWFAGWQKAAFTAVCMVRRLTNLALSFSHQLALGSQADGTFKNTKGSAWKSIASIVYVASVLTTGL